MCFVRMFPSFHETVPVLVLFVNFFSRVIYDRDRKAFIDGHIRRLKFSNQGRTTVAVPDDDDGPRRL